MATSDVTSHSLTEPARESAAPVREPRPPRGESRPITVIKVGGSLLRWPELPTRLAEFLQSRSNERLALVVGGGAVVDEIRQLDSVHQFGDSIAHRLAIRALDLTARLLESMIFGLEVVDDAVDRDRVWSRSCIAILAPGRFMEQDAERPDALAQDWSITSDSIAARVAERWSAQELILLKSASLPVNAGCEEAAKLGLIDSRFPEVSRQLPRVSYLNIRGEGGKPVLLDARG
jgi:5-(aminomethyl)-3-furanmethanol phosphate kinase